MTRVVGLDLSLRATGVAHVDGGTEVWHPPERPELAKRGVHRTIDDDMARLDWLDARLCWLIHDQGVPEERPELVVIEGYSRGSLAKREEAGELGVLARLACWRAEVPFVLVPPKLLKVFACNSGNADKPAVAVAAVRAGWTGDGHDAADAWWLRQMGLYAVDGGDVPVTNYRAEAVAKVTWPRVGMLAESLDFDAPATTIDTAAL